MASKPQYDVVTVYVGGDLSQTQANVLTEANAHAMNGYKLVGTEHIDGPEGTVGILLIFELREHE